MALVGPFYALRVWAPGPDVWADFTPYTPSDLNVQHMEMITSGTTTTEMSARSRSDTSSHGQKYRRLAGSPLSVKCAYPRKWS